MSGALLTSDGGAGRPRLRVIEFPRAERAETEETFAAWRRPSVRIGLLAVGLSLFGLVMVASAAGTGGFATATLKRLVLTGFGLAAFAAGALVDYRFWRRHHLLILVGGFALLVAVLVPGLGAQINGAKRWLRTGLPIGLQPSEFAKIALIVWTAAYCERNIARMRGPVHGFLLPLSVAGAASLLVLLEPDFGTACLIGGICTAILLVFGMRLTYVLLGLAAAMPVLQKLVFEVPYRLQRVVTFMDPWSDPRGAGYQLIQSQIAIGSGGVLGRGLGAGVQKAGFLPGSDNDFIFSIVCEELGLIGAVAVLAAFAFLLWECLRVVVRSRDPFGFGLALGLAWMLGMQAAAHVAVVTGSVPTKGLSLPFVSAGGSSLLASMLAAGILVNIARAEEAPRARQRPARSEGIPDYERLARRAIRAVPVPDWARAREPIRAERFESEEAV